MIFKLPIQIIFFGFSLKCGGEYRDTMLLKQEGTASEGMKGYRDVLALEMLW